MIFSLFKGYKLFILDLSAFFKNISQETQRREYLLTENGATEVSRMVAKEIQTQKIPFLKNQLVLPQ